MKSTGDIYWLHNGRLIESDEERGIFVEESIVHDCCLITRWPKMLAGMMAFYPCRTFSLSSLLYTEHGEERQAWRKCDRNGRWTVEDYSECPFTHEVTRHLHAFSLMPVNDSSVLEYAQQLMTYTKGASDFTDKMDVVLVADMMERMIKFVGQIKHLEGILVEIASNIMSVDDHILWMAQNEAKACTRIVHCVGKISGLSLDNKTQVLSKVSLNIALEAVLIKPATFIGMTCIAYQQTSAHSERALIRSNKDVDAENINNLILKCTSGSLTGSLLNFSTKNAVAIASIHLPQSVFAQSPSLQSVDNSTCKLQLIVFRNGKLFQITGNTSYLADQGKRREVATPAVLSKIDGFNFGNLTDPLTIALRHITRGVDPIAAVWDFDLLDGHGGWCGEGCHLITSAGNITTLQCTHFGNFAVLMDLKTVLSYPQYPGEFLHPVVYACTAVMLLCLFASIITYIVHHSTIRISRKGWHMLLNFCFHTALTFAVFAGGINRTGYPIICQSVGIVLHYSSLCTVLWIGVTARNIYKQVTRKPSQNQNAEQPQFPKQPMLRFYLISGGVPFIICGVTAATNLKNYGNEDNAPYCWMAWEPSLGAFYGPAAFIVLVTCIYFLCTYVQLKRHPERKYELKERTEEQQRLAGAEMGHSHMAEAGPVAQATCSMISSSLLENEHSFKAQLRAAAFTLFLFTATWTFGALAVSQGHFLDMIFSCLYGAFCVTLGLFTLIHHCAKRDDVWHCWWSCCPSKRNAYPVPVNARQKVNVNGDAQGLATCIQESPCPNKSPMYNHPSVGHCKLTNLQASQNHVNCLSPVTPCCAKIHCEQLMEDEAHIHVHNEGAFRPNMHVHRCLKSRTKPRYFSRHRSAAEREYAYHIPSSIDGSIHSSHTDSPHSTHEGHTGHRRGCCAASDYPTISQPESSDASTAIFSCGKMPDSDTVHHTHFEMQPRRQSFPFNTTNPNGVPKGSMHEAMIYSSDNTGNIKTGPWRNETTV
ncbi:adhesion G protein-coupled receptor A1 isoform 2-T2 [Mantella aurantiaca]